MNEWIQRMLEQEAKNQEYLERLEKELAHAPEGDLRLSTYRGAARFYRSKMPGAKDEYLGNKQEALRAALAQKKYDLLAKQSLEQEQKAIHQVLKTPWPTLLEVFDSLPKEVQQLVEPLILPDDEYIRRWLEHYSRSASGADYRSRIELLFHTLYDKYEVPHVYEPSLFLEDFGIVHPDFVVLNVQTRQTFYHEHFGMMDDPDYRAANLRKLRAYHNNGYFEGKNLFVTMEADGTMVDQNELERLIRTYFK